MQGVPRYLVQHLRYSPRRQRRAAGSPGLLSRHHQPQQGLGESARDPLAHGFGQQADPAAVYQRPDIVVLKRRGNLACGSVDAGFRRKQWERDGPARQKLSSGRAPVYGPCAVIRSILSANADHGNTRHQVFLDQARQG